MTGNVIHDERPSKPAGRTLRVLLRLGVCVTSVLLGGLLAEAGGQSHQHAGHSTGAVEFPVTCSQQAQADFNRAVTLLHHMTYPQAREAFERVATTDPVARWRTGASP